MVPSVQPVPAPAAPAGKAARAAAWESSFTSLLVFHHQHGHFQVPLDAEHRALHFWTVHQRSHLKAGAMPPGRRKRLQAAGFPGEPISILRRTGDRIWDRHLAALMAFHRAHGHFLVRPETGKPGSLWEWSNAQRRKHNAGTLHPDRKRCLDAFGFPWSARNERWEARFAELAVKQKLFGHCRFPADGVLNPALARWMENQRLRRKNGALNPEYINRLDRLGFVWELPHSPVSQDGRWQARFDEFVAYRERFGHCLVPAFWRENQALANWVNTQRRRRKAGSLTPERLDRLEALGFCWDASPEPDASWNTHFDELAAYRKQSGHCLVPAAWPENPALAGWVRLQRSCRKKGKLSPERLDRLGRLGFVWNASTRPESEWDAKYAGLVAFRQRFGHCYVPHLWAERPALGVWVQTQREKRAAGTLPPEHLARLDEIHFLWTGGWEALGAGWRQKQKDVMGQFYREPHPPSVP